MATPTAPRIALASYPRSGNTWVRFLLEAATGERCGSVYADRIMPRDSEGLVIKTHELDAGSYASAIHLVRNPFDAIESYFHWRRDIGGDRRTEWREHVAQCVEGWERHTAYWLATPLPCRRIRYEDLHASPDEVLRGLLAWLERPVDAAAIATAVAAANLSALRDLHPTLGTHFFRRGEIGASHAAFTRQQRRAAARRLKPLLDRLGYAGEPNG